MADRSRRPRQRHVTRLLIVFVKAPTPGQVKTRLLSVLSPGQAADLYRALVEDTLRAVAALRGITPAIAYAADATFPNLSWLGESYVTMLQRGRTLGERLIQAFAWAFEQDAKEVVVLGSDAPTLSPGWIRQAFQALQQADVVVGPTVDGGYHLIGLKRPHPELLTRMPWSTPRLFRQTVSRIEQAHLRLHALTPVADLDTPDDLYRYLAQQPPARRRSRITRLLTKWVARSPVPLTS